MIYFKVNEMNVIRSIHYFPEKLGKTEEELLKEGYLVDSIPEPPQKEGKIAFTKYVDGEFIFEYEDIPEEPLSPLEERVTELEDIILMLTM